MLVEQRLKSLEIILEKVRWELQMVGGGLFNAKIILVEGL